VQVGYLSPDDARELPAEVVAFLDRGEPPVYLGFGSSGEADPDATTAMLVDGARRGGRRVVLSRGVGKLGASAGGDDVLVVGECDHAKLFPRVAAVVHHGGAGTTASAARAGTPQVIVSHLNEQHAWGLRTHALGVGARPIPRAKLTAARLGDAIARATGDPATTRRARELSARLLDQDPAATAVQALSQSA